MKLKTKMKTKVVIQIFPTKLRVMPPARMFSFNSHKIAIGKSGSGKTNAMENFMIQLCGVSVDSNEKAKAKGIDLTDSGGRLENFLFDVEENQGFLNRYPFKEINPQAYKTQKIMIAGSRLEYIKELPNGIEIRSLDPESLNLSDLKFIVAESEPARRTLDYIVFKYGNINLLKFFELLKTKLMSDKIVPRQLTFSFLRRVSSLLSSEMFSDQFSRIDFVEILKDRERITSFSTFLFEDSLQEGLFYGLALRKIFEAKSRHFVDNPVYVYCRELSIISSRLSGQEMKLAQQYLLKILRFGRDMNLNLLADSQRFRDLLPAFRINFGLYIFMKSDFAEAMAINEITLIPFQTLLKIPRLDIGQALILSNEFKFPVFIPPVPFMHKKPNMDVLKVLTKLFGTQSIDYKLDSSTRGFGNFEAPDAENFDIDRDIGGLEDVYG